MSVQNQPPPPPTVAANKETTVPSSALKHVNQADLERQYASTMANYDRVKNIYTVYDVVLRSVLFFGMPAFLLTNFTHEELYPGSKSWLCVFLPRMVLASCYQPFVFAVSHVYLHLAMLNGWQCNRTVMTPFAFYHHYLDPLMYCKIPVLQVYF